MRHPPGTTHDEPALTAAGCKHQPGVAATATAAAGDPSSTCALSCGYLNKTRRVPRKLRSQKASWFLCLLIRVFIIGLIHGQCNAAEPTVTSLGTSASPPFSRPYGVALDSSGNIIVAETNSNLVRRIDAVTGAVTSLGASAVPAFVSPWGVAVDSSGNIIVADFTTYLVRRINAVTGAVTSLGTSASPAFSGPRGVAVDSSGNIIVADTNSNLVRRIDAVTGAVTSLGTAFYNPHGVAVDSSGNVFVADMNNLVRRIDAVTGAVTSLGTSASPAFSGPRGVAVDSSGNIIVADTNSNLVRRIDAVTGAVTSLGTAASPAFSYPWGVAVDSSGNIIVADHGNNLVRKVMGSTGPTYLPTPSPSPLPSAIPTAFPTRPSPSPTPGPTAYGYASTAITLGTSASPAFDSPRGVAVDAAGAIYLTDYGVGLVKRIASTSPAAAVTTLGTSASPAFVRPWGIAVDANANVFVSDYTLGLVRCINGTTGAVTSLGTSASPAFSSPAGVAVDRFGTAYVADSGNNRVRVIAAGTGAVSSLGTAASPAFSRPLGVAVDLAGNVYVADTGNSLVRVIAASSGLVTSLGTSASPALSSPYSVAVDLGGDVLVADYGSNTVRRIAAATGVVSSIGTAASPAFSRPSGVAVDAMNGVYVADYGNGLVREVSAVNIPSPTGQPSSQPSRQPSSQPSRHPSGQPTSQPSRQPSSQPAGRPSAQPSGQPTSQPTGQPSLQPSMQPTSQPSRQPSGQPTGQPSLQPSRQPSSQPTGRPSAQPSRQPASQPTGQPSRQPTSRPTRQPSRQPSGQPTGRPSAQPSRQPTSQPTGQPSRQPSGQPTGKPTRKADGGALSHFTRLPTGQPTGQPLGKPSKHPTPLPTAAPTFLMGGMLYSDTSNYYVVFLSSGTFVAPYSTSYDVLVVAGGGGGGSGHAGGGGAGGVVAYLGQPLVSGTSYPVTVGLGGAGGAAIVGYQEAAYLTGVIGSSGGNSQFGTLAAAIGGGGGGSYSGGFLANSGYGLVGGSGGGGGADAKYSGVAGVGGGTTGQGFAGGTAAVAGSIYFGNSVVAGNGGGGGGAGGVGGAAYSTGLGFGYGGTGGAAVSTVAGWGSLSAMLTATGLGVSGAIAGGGGGGGWDTAAIAPGGGGGAGFGMNTAPGYQSASKGQPATASTGSGGGGGPSYTTGGGAGGSGFVVIRYGRVPSAAPTLSPTSAPTLAPSETTDGDALCTLYNTATNKGALSNWCGTKNVAGNYVNGPCTGASTWFGVSCTTGRVTVVNLWNAGLGGVSIPSGIIGLGSLNYLNLDSNGLAGPIPSYLVQLTSLQYLYLHRNALTGRVPSSFCGFSTSFTLALAYNSGITCYPSCLASNPYFLTGEWGGGSALAVCPSPAPTSAPTSPTPAPTYGSYCGMAQSSWSYVTATYTTTNYAAIATITCRVGFSITSIPQAIFGESATTSTCYITDIGSFAYYDILAYAETQCLGLNSCTLYQQASWGKPNTNTNPDYFVVPYTCSIPLISPPVPFATTNNVYLSSTPITLSTPCNDARLVILKGASMNGAYVNWGTTMPAIAYESMLAAHLASNSANSATWWLVYSDSQYMKAVTVNVGISNGYATLTSTSAVATSAWYAPNSGAFLLSSIYDGTYFNAKTVMTLATSTSYDGYGAFNVYGAVNTYSPTQVNAYGDWPAPAWHSPYGANNIVVSISLMTSIAITIQSVMYYKTTSANSVARYGAIYSSTGTQYANSAFTFPLAGETASGWQTVQLTTPISIAAGSTFLVAVSMYDYVTSYFPRTSVGPFTNINSVYSTCSGSDPCLVYPTNSQTVNRMIDFTYTQIVATTRGLVMQLDAATYSGSGNWVDSVSGLQFVPYGAPPPTYSSSVGGGSFAFDPASGQYMQSTTALPLLTTWSIEVWLLYSGTFAGSYPSIVADKQIGTGACNFVLGASPSGGSPTALFASYSTSGWSISDSTSLPTTGVFYQIVATFDGTSASIYVNNVLKVSSNIAGTPMSGGVGIRLMRRWDLPDYYGGSLGLVRIYSVALTAGEVSANWAATKGRFGYGAAVPAVAVPTALPTSLPTFPQNALFTYYPSSSFPLGSALVLGGQILGTLSLPAAYKVVFDVYPTADTVTDWRTLVRISASGQNWESSGNGNYGRLPVVQLCNPSIVTNSTAYSVCVSYAASGTTNSKEATLSTFRGLPLATWSTISVSIDNNALTMLLAVSGGLNAPTQTKSFLTPIHVTVPFALVYAADPYYSPALASIRNLAVLALTSQAQAQTSLPSGQPTGQPSGQPTDQPTGQPTGKPSQLHNYAPLAPTGAVAFAYTGGEQTWTVPAGITRLQIDACGGQGDNKQSSSLGSTGGYVRAIITVTPGSTLYIEVGGGSGLTFNGGGSGNPCCGSSGGGATDVRASSSSSSNTLDTRLVVAGGAGGGRTSTLRGGSGGGLIGGTNIDNLWTSTGGSQSSAGQGNGPNCGNGGPSGSFGSGGVCSSGSGGGGGYWGGGGGTDAGGGGSSFVFPNGTFITNTQGDSRCAGNGQLFISIPPSPSPEPTAAPTVLYNNAAVSIGTSASPAFLRPSDVAVDAYGNVVVSDYGNSLVRFISISTGNVTTLGTSASPAFKNPWGVAVDSRETVYVADWGNGLVRACNTTSGVVINIGTAANPPFKRPSGIAVDGSLNVYVADAGTNLIRKIAAGTGRITSLGSSASPSFSRPLGLAIDVYGSVFVADQGNWLVRKISVNGTVVALGTSADPAFLNPSGVAVDVVGNCYVSDQNGLVRVIDSAGTARSLGTLSAPPFNNPQGLAVDNQGVLTVADSGNNLVRVISALTGLHPTTLPTPEPTGPLVPSPLPTLRPTPVPTASQTLPTAAPTVRPTRNPTPRPSAPSPPPSIRPTQKPLLITKSPTGQPSRVPTGQPSSLPTRPTGRPTNNPTSQPTRTPSRQPTSRPSRRPTRQPTGQPTRQPTRQPTSQPSRKPTRKPSGQPTRVPTGQPSRFPSGRPTSCPTGQPSRRPSRQPSGQPSRQPSRQPTRQPTAQPTRQPTRQPTSRPSRVPTGQPSREPSGQPSSVPTTQPSRRPSRQPTRQPTRQPSSQPSRQPTGQPSRKPSRQPTSRPTRRPTAQPTRIPSSQPSSKPSRVPTGQPSRQPTRRPTSQPSRRPSSHPTMQPSAQPSSRPTRVPSSRPTRRPSSQPTRRPSGQPSRQPSRTPTKQPSSKPSRQPTAQPTRVPTNQPTSRPSRTPTGQPSRQPTGQPSRQPSRRPSRQPSSQPSSRPTRAPTYAAQTAIAFNVSHTLSGISIGTWNKDPAIAVAFAKAVAASINTEAKTAKLDSTNVRILKVRTPTTLERSLLLHHLQPHPQQMITNQQSLEEYVHFLEQSLQQCHAGASSTYLDDAAPQSRLLQSSGSVAVDYTVSTTTQQAGNSNAAQAYSAISSALTTSVTGTTFQTQLISAAATITGLSTVVASTTAPQVSTPVFVVTHSAEPSGSPTGRPTLRNCPEGYRHAPVGTGATCIICDPGTYSAYSSTICSICSPGTFSREGSGGCTKCPLSTYSDGWGIGPECKRCTWPATSAFVGSTNCLAFSIGLDDAQMSGVVIFSALLYITCCSLAAKPERFVINDILPAAAFTIMPAIDFVSDVLYVLQTVFYNEYLAYLCVIFIFVSNAVLFQKLYKMGALMPHIMFPLPDFLVNNRMLFLSRRGIYPLYHGVKMRSLSFEKLDTLLKLITFILVWVGCIALQALGLFAHVCLWIPILMVHVVFSIIWIILGLYLFQIKMLAVGRVWTAYFRVWRRGDEGKHDSKTLIDTVIMNESFLYHFLVETLPQLFLQAYNNQYCGTWIGLALFSTCLSIFMVINGIYRYGYYILVEGKAFGEVPLEIAVGTTIIKLNPATHDGGVHGLIQNDKLVDPADLQMMDLHQDSRFNELLMLLNSVDMYRNSSTYRSEFTHLFGHNAKLPKTSLWPEQIEAADAEAAGGKKKSRLSAFFSGKKREEPEGEEEKEGDFAIQVQEDGSTSESSAAAAGGAGGAGGGGGKKKPSSRLSLFFGPAKTVTAEALVMGDDAPELTKKDWLDELDCVVAEFEVDDMPILSDLLVYTIMRSFKDNVITTEGHLCAVIDSLPTRAARRCYIRDTLLFRSIIYELVLLRYFDVMGRRARGIENAEGGGFDSSSSSHEGRISRFADYFGSETDSSTTSSSGDGRSRGRRRLTRPPRRRVNIDRDGESGSSSSDSDSDNDGLFIRPPAAPSQELTIFEKLGLGFPWATGQALTIKDDNEIFIPPPPKMPFRPRRGRGVSDILVVPSSKGKEKEKEEEKEKGKGKGKNVRAKARGNAKHKGVYDGDDDDGDDDDDSGSESGSESDTYDHDVDVEVEGSLPIASVAAFNALDSNEVAGLEAMKAWLGKCDLTPRNVQRYASLLYLDKGCASVDVLAKRTQRNQDYLTEVGVDAEDAPLILSGLTALEEANKSLALMKTWLTSRGTLTPANVQRYAAIFFDKGCASVEVLAKRVTNNSKYLSEVGVDSEDVAAIATGLISLEDSNKSLEAFKAWLGKCDMTLANKERYAILLFVEKGCASVNALAKRLERNPRYLSEAGVDLDDAAEIIKALRKGGLLKGR